MSLDSTSRPLVTILQHRLLHYRVDFFGRLRRRCEERGIELRLVHGQAAESERVRNDEGQLDWADRVTNRYWRVRERDVLWQPLPRALRHSDLVVLMQENRILSNYPYLLGLKPSRMKIGYWGHGANLQSRAPDGLRERWKRALLSRVDWWFAYTGATVELLRRNHYPEDRISRLNNAVDTKGFARAVHAASAEEICQLLVELGIPADAHIGIFCGSLYPDKRLELMIDAADLVWQKLPGFHLIVIGDGPSGELLRAAARERPWLHLVGSRRDREKARLFRLAHVMLNPGSLGLHILDSFSIGLPLISTTGAFHGPEIAYLENGISGELVENSPRAYSDAIIRILMDRDYREKLSAGARAAGDLYTVEGMVTAFVEGIEGCLQRPSYRRSSGSPGV